MKFGFFHTMPWTLHQKALPWPADTGVFDPAAAEKLYRGYLDCIASAEQFGFDWLCCNEHHFSPYGLMANCNLMGAALVYRTTSSRLAMVGNLVPMLNPIRVAEEYAMLDVMSGGRLIAGFMRGVPHEYLAYNANPSESFGRLREAIALITAPGPSRIRLPGKESIFSTGRCLCGRNPTKNRIPEFCCRPPMRSQRPLPPSIAP
jgi:alkanesulfonate monooxygenase SsuD/methylene tetrahydromethanopterin reductase-like flavin-dependent oxidoreductase (luciferase family)